MKALIACIVVGTSLGGLAGCSSKDANKGNFKAAIQNYLDTTPALCASLPADDGKTSFQLEKQQEFLRSTIEQAEALAAAGLLTARDVELPGSLLEQRPGHEQAVALPQPVEPVAVADEVADLEQAVAVGRPGDPLEEPILVGPVVAGGHGVAGAGGGVTVATGDQPLYMVTYFLLIIFFMVTTAVRGPARTDNSGTATSADPNPDTDCAKAARTAIPKAPSAISITLDVGQRA